jgi:hypothetical protein
MTDTEQFSYGGWEVQVFEDDLYWHAYATKGDAEIEQVNSVKAQLIERVKALIRDAEFPRVLAALQALYGHHQGFIGVPESREAHAAEQVLREFGT